MSAGASTSARGRRSWRRATGAWLGLDPASPRGRAAALLTLDERDGEVLLRRRLRGTVRGLAVSDDGVWVVTQRGRGTRMVQLDPGTGTRVRAITVPANPGRLAAGGGRVWLSTLCEGPSCRIDRASVRGWDAATGGSWRVRSPRGPPAAAAPPGPCSSSCRASSPRRAGPWRPRGRTGAAGCGSP